MIDIVPAILTDNPQELRGLIERCEGVVPRVQIDIIDGVFAKNKTIDPIALSQTETALMFDFQLMVKEPINWIEKCIRAGADRIIGHIEMMENQYDFVRSVQDLGFAVGLGIDLQTQIEQLELSSLREVDVVLVMSVQAGFGGQKFDEHAIAKVKRLDEMRQSEGLKYKIQVDGGVTLDNVADLVRAAADEVVAGRLLFDGDLVVNIQEFREAEHNA